LSKKAYGYFIAINEEISLLKTKRKREKKAITAGNFLYMSASKNQNWIYLRRGQKIV
jgi:hypothetical protein